ncbi:hypothetical protein [Guptibacillus hwajinpoensis]|uniref:hypothetical protein n=1 Tax=Guptibacillus hwajinpoensis TaxID=208199 RepID=UPI0037364CC8
MQTRAEVKRKRGSQFKVFRSFTFWGILIVLLSIGGVLMNHQLLKDELRREYGYEARKELAVKLDVPIEEIAKPRGIHVTNKGEEWVEQFNLGVSTYQPELKEIYRLEFLINHNGKKYGVMGHYAVYYTEEEVRFDPNSVHELKEE